MRSQRHATVQVSPDYGVEEECILKGDGEMGGAYIVRLPAGNSDIYLRCGVVAGRLARVLLECF